MGTQETTKFLQWKVQTVESRHSLDWLARGPWKYYMFIKAPEWKFVLNKYQYLRSQGRHIFLPDFEKSCLFEYQYSVINKNEILSWYTFKTDFVTINGRDIPLALIPVVAQIPNRFDAPAFVSSLN